MHVQLTKGFCHTIHTERPCTKPTNNAQKDAKLKFDSIFSGTKLPQQAFQGEKSMLAKVTVSHYTHRETMHCTNYAKKDAKQKFDSIFSGYGFSQQAFIGSKIIAFSNVGAH